MYKERLDRALSEASDTHQLLIADGALARVEGIFAAAFGQARARIVADETTFAVAGQLVQEGLRAAGRDLDEAIILPATPPPYADFAHVLELEAALATSDATPLVVGSGTLNDITKLAAHRLDRQYLCVGTAASMDGYTAFGAAITKDGFKQTMACPAPRALVADLDVLAQAPPALNAAGYGDLLGKVTAGADWLLADAMAVEPIEPRSWALVQDSLRDWTGQPERVRAGERQAVAALFEGLVLTGLAMQLSASSRPASGSEHRFSHLWEMQALALGHPPVPHGFKVGIGSLCSAALYERLLAHDLLAVDIEQRCAAWPSREEVAQRVYALHSSPQLAESAVEETLAKYIDAIALRARLQLFKERWPELRPRLVAQLLPAAQLREQLQAAGCPTDPAEVGVSRTQLKASYQLARSIRSRYTVLDLAEELGLLDQCVEQIFAAGGFWADPDE